jgi:hypothetical protein
MGCASTLAGIELVMFNDHTLIDGLGAICNRYSASDGVLIDPKEWWDSHWIKDHIASRLTWVQRLKQEEPQWPTSGRVVPTAESALPDYFRQR